MEEGKSFTIVKKIAKQGSQAVIVVPKMLEDQLKPGTVTQLKIDIIKEVKERE